MSKHPTIRIYAVYEDYHGRVKMDSSDAELRKDSVRLKASDRQAWRYRSVLPRSEVHMSELDAAKAFFREKMWARDTAAKKLADADEKLAAATKMLRKCGGDPEAEADAVAESEAAEHREVEET